MLDFADNPSTQCQFILAGVESLGAYTAIVHLRNLFAARSLFSLATILFPLYTQIS
jgi:hypothetical protein